MLNLSQLSQTTVSSFLKPAKQLAQNEWLTQVATATLLIGII